MTEKINSKAVGGHGALCGKFILPVNVCLPESQCTALQHVQFEVVRKSFKRQDV